MEAVSFIPRGSDRPVLKNVRFSLEPGEVLGIIGPSGAGKSTLARLLVGLWQPTAGGIFLDGHDVYSWERSSFGAQVGYLPQNAALLDGTVRENIARFSDADPADVIAAAKRAEVHEIIGRLPLGYETMVGEAGFGLSGGQRQRIALARALFGAPKLLVLDEPNSNVDGAGEQALLAAIREAKRAGTTVIVIAHRMSVMVARRQAVGAARWRRRAFRSARPDHEAAHRTEQILGARRRSEDRPTAGRTIGGTHMTNRPGHLLPALGGLSEPDNDVEPSLRGTALAGLVTIVACFGGFAGWSLLADLDSAVIASGFAVVDSHRKTVQHLEGGILHELLVREGDIVRAGQPLAILDTTQADAQLGQLTSQLVAVEAKLARLRAEQQDLRTVEFPGNLTDQHGVELVVEALETQRRLFLARWRAYDSSVAIIRKRIQQFKEQIAASQSQSASVDTQLELMEEDLKNVTYLYERGYERRPRMLELRRSVQELRGQQAQLRGAVAEAQQSIAGAEMEIVNLGDARQSEVAKELQDLRAQQADLADRIRAARDVRERRHIISPQDGVVTDLRLVTPGGVIGSGQPLMDIVPVDDELIIETRIHPDDIDVVRPGLPAQVRLTAFKRSTTPTDRGRGHIRLRRHAHRSTQRRDVLPIAHHTIAAIPPAIEEAGDDHPGHACGSYDRDR